MHVLLQVLKTTFHKYIFSSHIFIYIVQGDIYKHKHLNGSQLLKKKKKPADFHGKAEMGRVWGFHKSDWPAP